MHFLGGMWLAGTGLWLVYTRRGTPLPRFSVIFAVGVIFALGVGFLWEVFEAGLSLRTLGHINAMPDTLGDLFFDAVGSAMFSVWAWFSIKNN